MTHHAPTRRGYTLMEVLIAMGIFVIGFAAVAAMFPAGTYLQRETIQDVTSQQFARSAEASLLNRPFLVTDFPSVYGVLPSGNVQAMAPWLESSPAGGPQPDWTLEDRTYLSMEATVTNRSYVWVPLIQCTDVPNATLADSWRVYVFVLKREPNVAYTAGTANPQDTGFPGVRNIGVTPVGTNRFDFNNDQVAGPASDPPEDQVMPGDQIVDNNGTVYTVDKADAGGVDIVGVIVTLPLDPTSIWYSPPGTNLNTNAVGNSSTRRIFPVTGAVK